MTVGTTQLAPGNGHNYIINGAFDFWQRGTSFSVTAGIYTADRWEANPSGGAGTVTQEEFTPAEIEAIGFGDAKYFLRYDLTTANDNARLEYPIEDVRTLAGQTATVSFWAKTNATNLDVRLDQLFGSGGSSQVPGEQNITLTTSWARYSVTFDLPSISGKTIGTDSYLRFQLFNPNFETFTLDVWGVQVEAGSVATPFKRNANSIAGELAACQRYYQKVTNSINGAIAFGNSSSTTQVRLALPVGVAMRTDPDLSLSSAGNARLQGGAVLATVSSITDVISSGNNVFFRANATTSLTARESFALTDTEYELDAEL